MEAATSPNEEADPDTLGRALVEIRPGDGVALAGGQVLPLSRRELEVLLALLERRGRVVARDELYRVVWKAELRPDDRSVDVYVHKLRRKLARAIPGHRVIHTHFGRGYRFDVPRGADAPRVHTIRTTS